MPFPLNSKEKNDWHYFHNYSTVKSIRIVVRFKFVSFFHYNVEFTRSKRIFNRTLRKRQLYTSFLLETKHSLDGFVIDSFSARAQGETQPVDQSSFKLQLQSSCDLAVISTRVADTFTNPQYIHGVEQIREHAPLVRVNQLGKYGVVPNPESIDGTACVKYPWLRGSLSNSILTKLFNTDIMSFWFDLSVTEAKLKKNPDIPTGEVSFGSDNYYRFVFHTENAFELQSYSDPQNPPAGWITKKQVTLRIESKSGGAKRLVTFDIGEPDTYLPKEMYNAVIGAKLRQHLDPLGRGDKVPKDVSSQVDAFAGSFVKLHFPCAMVDEILGFSLNNMLVPRTFLFEMVDMETCVLRVRPNAAQDKKDVTIGFHVIKQFHLTVDFTKLDRPFAIFRKRDGKKASSKLKSCAIC